MRFKTLNNFGSIVLVVLLSPIFVTGQVKEENLFNKIKLNFLLSGGYEYNFNNPSDMKNSLRIFDLDHNSFKMDLLQLSFHQDASNDQPFGFRADIMTGSSVPKAIRSTGLNSGDLDIMQMYITYIIPIGNGLKVDFGKFVTFLGYEVIEGWENYNENYSRSFAFGYSIPYTHTGIKANYTFNEKVSLSLYLVNGWDNSIDNNKSKSVGAQLVLNPITGMNICTNFLYGPEQNNNNSNNRNIFEIAGTYNIGNMTLGLNSNFASESFSDPSNYTVNWNSFAGYLKYNISNSFSLAIRGELFTDPDGVRTGTKQDLSEFTITPAFAINNNLIIRGEIRFDKSDKDSFASENSFSNNQTTIAVNLIYHL